MTEMKEFIDALYKMFQTAIQKTFRDILPEYREKQQTWYWKNSSNLVQKCYERSDVAFQLSATDLW